MSTIDGFKAAPLTEDVKATIVEKFGEAKADKIVALFEVVASETAATDAFAGLSKGEMEFIASLDPNLAEALDEIDKTKNTDANQNAPVQTPAPAASASSGGGDVGDIDALNAEIERLDAEIEASKEQLDEKTVELEDAKAAYLKEQEEYDKLQKEYKEKENKYDEISNAINSATEGLEDSVKSAQQDAIYKAMGSYNEQEDGDWNAYLQKQLEGVLPDSKLQGLIESLTGESKGIATELGALKNKMAGQSLVLDSAKIKYDAAQAEVTNLESTIATSEASKTEMSQKVVQAVMNSISAEEMALVKDNNINLNEKYPDGSPKYIFAKGKEDGKYHIYEMSPDGTNGTSLARTYGCNGGYDIIESGNGYLNGLQKTGDCGGEKIYYLNDCGSAGSFNGCYSTCSPLSFDLNGDGVKTSDAIVDFDIDGDGIVDKINDSADGVLVFDSDGDGISGEDGSECFGDNTDIDGDGKKDGYKDGFEALKSFALKAGVINGEDDMVIDENDIKYLEENFGFKMKAGGYNSEAQSLLDLGITEINLAKTDETTMNDDFDGQHNQLMTQQGATFKQNGETKEYADIWHRKYEE